MRLRPTDVCVAAALLLPAVANAQYKPLVDVLVGGVVQGVLQGATRGASREQAQVEWANLDPAMMNCLAGRLPMPPQQLADQGILPSDPRLGTYVKNCQLILTTEAQKRQVADQERRRRDEEMRREALARQEIGRQQEAAERKVKEADRRMRETVATLRADPAIRPLLAQDSVTLLIAAGDTANMTRGLDGAPRFRQPPDLCLATAGPLASGHAFGTFVRARMEQKIQSPYRERSCSPRQLNGRDFMVMSSNQLDAAPPDVQIGYMTAVRSKAFVPFLTVTTADFGLAEDKRKDEVTALERRLASNDDIFVLVYGTAPAQSLCVIAGERADRLVEVFGRRRADWADAVRTSPAVRTVGDADAAFVKIKRGECGALLVAGSVARGILEGLRRDGTKVELHPAVIAGSEIGSEPVKPRESKVAEDGKPAIEQKGVDEVAAARRREDESRQAEADRSRCRSRTVTTDYFISSCVLAGAEGRPDVNLPPLQQKREEERVKLSGCPSDIVDAVGRAGRQYSRQAAANVNALVVFQDGLESQCRKLAATALE